MQNKNMKYVLLTGTIIVMSLTACAKQAASQPSDNEIKEVVQDYIATNVDDTAETTSTFDSQSESIENEEKLSEEMQALIDKLSLVAVSENGKAFIYADINRQEGYVEWVSDIYLLYDNNIRKLPYAWFTKYTYDDISVKCRDFDDDGADEIAIIKSWTGGTMINVSDVVFIENPGTDMEHHYIYNTWLDKDEYEYKRGDYQVDDYQLTGIHIDVYDYIEEYVKNDGSPSYIIGIREKNSDYDISAVLSDNESVVWDDLVDIKFTYNGFDVMNSPCTLYESIPRDWRAVHMCFRYLGDGNIELQSTY